MSERRCEGTNASGERCGVRGSLVDAESGFCFNCDPAKEEERRRARKLGGMVAAQKQAKAKGIHPDDLGPLTTPADAERWAAVIGAAAASGRIPASRAQAALRSINTFLQARDAGETQDRIERLSERVEALVQGTGMRVVR